MILREERIGDQRLILGDCLDVLPTLGRFDAVVTDPPYGTTQCAWDAAIPFAAMWGALASCIGPDTPVLLFGSEPFSSMLRASNLRRFKYDWIWDKPKATGFLNAANINRSNEKNGLPPTDTRKGWLGNLIRKRPRHALPFKRGIAGFSCRKTRGQI